MSEMLMDVDADVAEAQVVASSEALDNIMSDNAQYVIFSMRGEQFAVIMGAVSEIIRLPKLVSVPLAAHGIQGVANLRGRVLPIVSLADLFQLDSKDADEATRVLVINHKGSSIGFVVDRVEKVITVDASLIERNSTVSSNVGGQFLDGMIKPRDNSGSLSQIVDFSLMIEHCFADMTENTSSAVNANAGAAALTNVNDNAEREHEEDMHLISFTVYGQEYAVPINQAKEIVQVPSNISQVPNTPSHILGVITLRQRLLPLVSLRQIFGMPVEALDESNRILVMPISIAGDQEAAVGVVVDSVNEVLRVNHRFVDELPAVMEQHGDMNDISAICRLEDGARLVSVISPEALFSTHLMRSAADSYAQINGSEESMQQQVNDDDGMITDDLQFVVFRVAEEEYGAPIQTVKEIVRVPEKLTDVPTAPGLFEGIINLRGMVLPVVDMRTRFARQRMERNDRQRIMVFEVRGKRVGFVVDSVIEVLRIHAKMIEPAPNLSHEQAEVIRNIANLEAQGRMIMLLEADGLLAEDALASI
ncbi:MAG: chemotaxis protein CheW [Gammaproteobacteria bacterium]|nr:chemotaxis protein CheW [Gammaproteobacteria bacterium]